MAGGLTGSGLGLLGKSRADGAAPFPLQGGAAVPEGDGSLAPAAHEHKEPHLLELPEEGHSPGAELQRGKGTEELPCLVLGLCCSPGFSVWPKRGEHQGVGKSRVFTPGTVHTLKRVTVYSYGEKGNNSHLENLSVGVLCKRIAAFPNKKGIRSLLLLRDCGLGISLGSEHSLGGGMEDLPLPF